MGGRAKTTQRSRLAAGSVKGDVSDEGSRPTPPPLFSRPARTPPLRRAPAGRYPFLRGREKIPSPPVFFVKALAIDRASLPGSHFWGGGFPANPPPFWKKSGRTPLPYRGGGRQRTPLRFRTGNRMLAGVLAVRECRAMADREGGVGSEPPRARASFRQHLYWWGDVWIRWHHCAGEGG
jgi:hypothetical protein